MSPIFKKYFIETYGCQANIKDSQIMAGVLDALGLEQVKNYKNADIIILNSCSVRQKAEDKVYGWGVKLDPTSKKSQGKPDKKERLIFVTGCMVGSAVGERKRITEKTLRRKLPWVDYFLAPEEEVKIPNILLKEKYIDEWVLKKINEFDTGSQINPDFDNKTGWAYVNISTGCDNFCTFCVVPYARGKEISRKKGEILDEIKHLNNRGYKNIMLLGQNVNSWGLDLRSKFNLRAGSSDKIPFADLLRDVNDIKDVEKISFMSSNPFDFTRDLINALSLSKIDRYLHIAVQSGSNDVLKRMNRRHTIEEFTNLLDNIKAKIPEMTFGTDIIVGFPGETDDDFLKTVKLFKDYKFNVAFISIYSPREGTTAQKNFRDDVPIKVKRKRHAILTKVWEESLN